MKTFTSDDGLLATGTLGSGAFSSLVADVPYMMWYPRKAAFRAGGVDDTQWDDLNIGDNSAAFGYSTTAIGYVSTAMGKRTTASGEVSTAMGFGTFAEGNYSTAMGNFTSAISNYY